MSNKLAVIGLGSILRRDDGIGIAVLEILKVSYKRLSWDYLDFGVASFDLLHRLERYEIAVLIDAIHAGFSAGEVKIAPLEELVFKIQEGLVSSHQLSLKQLFELTKTLRLKCQIYLAGIQVEDISFTPGLSRTLENRRADIAAEIDGFIRKLLV